MKKIFGNVLHFLGTHFKDAALWVKDHIQPAIEAVNQVRHFVENDTLNVITDFIPGDLDDKAVKWLRDHLGKAIDTLAVTAGITNEPDFLKKLKLLIVWLRGKSPELQAGIYKQLQTLTAKSSGKAKGIPAHALDLLTALQVTKSKANIADGEDTAETEATAAPGATVWNPLKGTREQV